MFRATHYLRMAASKMTAAERQAARRSAHEKLKEYNNNRPPLEYVQNIKRRGDASRQKDFRLQMAFALSFVAAILASPFLGRRIASDEEFAEKYVPSWFDFRAKQPENEWTRDELHEQIVQLQKELHERAIRGDFTPEKLEEMRRRMAADDARRDGENTTGYESAWNQLHPGIDDDDDEE